MPKFASFRPKQQTHLEGDDQSQNQAKSEHREYPEIFPTPQSPGKIFGKRHHHQDERPRSKERRPRHRHHVPGNKGKRQGELFEVENPLPTVTERDETSEVFITDVRGDTNNLTYGTIHRYIIPPYLRAGAGNVVGLSTDNRIDRMSNSDKGLIISNRSLNRLGRREKYVFSKNVQKSQRQLRIQPVETPDQSFTDGNDFIPLTRLSSRKRKLGEDHKVQSISESSEEEDGNHYRSIEGKAKHRDGPADRDLEYATDSAASDDGGRRTISPDEATKQRGIELTRRVDAQPTNIDAWLDLIAHQDDLLVFGTGGERRNLTNAEKRSIADIKLSMYEKALQKLSKSDRVELIVLGVMEEGSKIWDTKKLGSKWRSVLEEYPGFIKLWTKYLDFQQTNFINFQYEECRTIFLNCLKVLTSISSNVSSAVSKDDINAVRIYVLLRLSLFMREAGYTEHALGLWQGILEFNFLQPEKFGLLAEDSRHAAYEKERLASFEEFWESEVSRIGEDGAEGWRTWTEKGGIAADPRTEASKVPVNDEEIFATWVCWERRQALQSRNIARTIDEVEENDPFRVILFPDIRDYLFYVGNARLRFCLLNAFLAFCRLPPLTSGDALNPVLGWREDSLIMNDLLEQSENFISRWYLDGSHGNSLEELAVGGQSNKSAQTADADRRTLFDLPITSYLLSPDTLFPEKGKWFSNFDSWPSRYDGDNGPIEQAWIRRVLRMLADVGAGDIDLAEYYLAFEWSIDAGSARKTAKSILKKQPTCLRLYNAYALIVARSGNRAASDHVFGTAINMSKTFAESARRDVILLWRTWIWEYLALGDHDSALKHLLALPESMIAQDLDLSDPQPAKSPSGPTVAALLRVQRVSVANLHTEMH